MLFQTLHRLREALATQGTKASNADAPVSITAMDAVLLSRVLLKRLQALHHSAEENKLAEAECRSLVVGGYGELNDYTAWLELYGHK